jgi:hypothetical protein
MERDLGWADLTAWTLYSDIENSFGADGTSGAFGFFLEINPVWIHCKKLLVLVWDSHFHPLSTLQQPILRFQTDYF